MCRRRTPPTLLTMTTSARPLQPLTRTDWLIPTGLIILSLVPAVAGGVRVAELAGGADVTVANARFFDAPTPVLVHILSVIPYSLLGAFQFSPGLRRRHRRWHRTAGRLLVVLGLLAAASGMWLTVAYDLPAADGETFGPLGLVRLAVGTAMVASILAALQAIRRRDWADHGAWMLRAYALGMGAGTQVLTHLPWMVLVGEPGEGIRWTLMTAGWVINITVAEWVIRRTRRLSARTGRAVHVRA